MTDDSDVARPINPKLERQHNTPEQALGAVLTTLRTAKGWSQEDLGDKVGCSEVYVNRLEHGRQSPTFRLIVALAQVFGLRPSQLLARAEKKYLK